MLSPAEFVKSYAAIGENKTKFSAGKLLLLGILAGFLIGMGGVTAVTCSHGIDNASVSRLVSGLVFPFGLAIVILTGSELFTGNCLITISVLEKKAKLPGMIRNLVLVYIGNFIGSLLLAAACAFCGQMDYSGGKVALAAIKTAVNKTSLPFGNAVVLGILCNVLVCMAVMCALSAKNTAGRAVGAYLPIAFFVWAGFEHCVANMYYIPAGLFAAAVPKYAQLAADAGIDISGLSWGSFLGRNLLPVTIGNIIGGCVLAAIIWGCNREKKA